MVERVKNKMNRRLTGFRDVDPLSDKSEHDDRRFGYFKDDYKFKAPYNTPEWRVFFMEGGFGLYSYTRGNAVIGFLLADGESFRAEKYQFERPATEQEIEAAWEFYKQSEDVKKKGIISGDDYNRALVIHRSYVARQEAGSK